MCGVGQVIRDRRSTQCYGSHKERTSRYVQGGTKTDHGKLQVRTRQVEFFGKLSHQKKIPNRLTKLKLPRQNKISEVKKALQPHLLFVDYYRNANHRMIKKTRPTLQTAQRRCPHQYNSWIARIIRIRIQSSQGCICFWPWSGLFLEGKSYSWRTQFSELPVMLSILRNTQKNSVKTNNLPSVYVCFSGLPSLSNPMSNYLEEFLAIRDYKKYNYDHKPT